MKKRSYVSLAAFLFCIFTLLSACDVLVDLGHNIDNLQATADSVESSLQESLELIETGRAVISNVEGSGLAQTAVSAATKFQESGILQTAQSIATEKGPELLETVQSFTTEQVPKLKGTAQAIATRYPMPSDLPLMEGEKREFQSSGNNVAYRIDVNIYEAIEFHENEMKDLGWNLIESASVINENGALMHYEKFDRKAVLAINIDPDTNETIVQITIQDG